MSNTNDPSAPIWFRTPATGGSSTRQIPASVSDVTGIGAVVAGLPAAPLSAQPAAVARARAPSAGLQRDATDGHGEGGHVPFCTLEFPCTAAWLVPNS